MKNAEIEQVRLNSLVNVMTTKTPIRIFLENDTKIFEGYLHDFLDSAIYDTVENSEVFKVDFKKHEIHLY